MAVEKGMITYYDGEYGEITIKDDKYIFLKQDVENEINLGSYVSFKGEEIQGIKRAYFVNNVEKNKLSVRDKIKQKEL